MQKSDATPQKGLQYVQGVRIVMVRQSDGARPGKGNKMIRQYGYTAGTIRFEDTPRGRMPVGVIKVGAIIRPHNATSNVEVLAWIPRDYASYSRGRFETKRISGGHLALVRNLRNGKVFALSDAWLRDAPEVVA